jgi:neutral ceramidase
MHRLLVPAFLLTLANLPLLSQDAKSTGLRAGAAAVDISPTVFPITLRSGSSPHVHDPLHVRAVALENGTGRTVIALIDDIGVSRETTDSAKAEVAAKTGWKVEEMLISGTHTHTAPKGGDTNEGRIAFEKRRLDGMVEALTKAIEALEPAEVGWASDEEPEEVHNRRWHLKPGTMEPNPFGELDEVATNPGRDRLLKPAGPTDPEVCIVDVRTRKRRPLGFIANYSLHYVGGIPTVRDEKGKEIGMASADYFGEFARIMPYRIGGSNPPANFVAMMTNGTSGDINNIDFEGKRPPRAPFEQVRIVAAKTADAAWRAARKIETYDENPLVAMRQREVELKYRNMSVEEVEHALRLLELPKSERGTLHDKAIQYANATVQYSEPDKTEKVLIQAIRIGEQAIVSLPFEVLVEIGLEIKEKSPFPNTFTISLANGGYGYLPPPLQHELGGYETWIGTSKFEKDSSVILTKQLLEMLAELRAL